MRNLIAFAAFAALSTLASAAIDHQPIKVLPASYSGNKTHFVDSSTSHVYRRHACAVNHDQATEHFKRTVKSLHARHESSAVGARAPAALARRQLPVPNSVGGSGIGGPARPQAPSASQQQQQQQQQQSVERKLTPYPLRNWEIMPDPTPVMGENDCAVSLGLFGARKL